MRVLPETLAPMSAPQMSSENADLLKVLQEYSRDRADTTAIEAFVNAHAASPWRCALEANLGTLYFTEGYFSKALSAWEEAWRLGKDDPSPQIKPLVDGAVANLARLDARLGRQGALTEVLAEAGGRDERGSAALAISQAKAALYIMQNHPADIFRCGPNALDRLLTAQNHEKPRWDALGAFHKIKASRATPNGISLKDLAELSRMIGMSYQVAKRSPGAPMIVPAIVHWKLGHYGALLQRDNARYLLSDTVFDKEEWISEAALDAESSGYYLVAKGPLPQGWSTVSDQEAATVLGKGDTPNKQPGTTTNHDTSKPPTDCGKGMATWSVHLMLVSLNIQDTPVGYTPPVGPEVKFHLNYDQWETDQPQTLNYSNLGYLWNFDWVSFLTFDSANAYLQGGSGGTDTFSNFDNGANQYAPQTSTMDVLALTGPSSYELRHPDGSKDIYNIADPSGRIYCSQRIDRTGNAINFGYDGSYRLTSVTDAIGQVTTLSYGLGTDIYKVTQVTDPFGRTAVLSYNANDELASITDEIGLVSQFGYLGSDFIHTLTTPYGTTTFAWGQEGPTVWLQSVDPQGECERVEFMQSAPGIADSDPPATVPQGMLTENEYLSFRNTFYWDREAMDKAPGDFTQARLYHWLHLDPTTCSGLLESVKAPLENRVWFNYQNEVSPPVQISNGMTERATAIGRVMDSGSTQLYQFAYNGNGNITQAIDPLGRTFTFNYAPNGQDLISAAQTTNGANDLLATYAYNAQHLIVSATDAGGQGYAYTYNAAGQLLTTVNPLGESAAITYNSNGYPLTYVAGAPGVTDTTSFTWDGFGRLASLTTSDGYTLQGTYDNLDRVTKVTYPDGTTDQKFYTALDLTSVIDRLGRETDYAYDPVRELIKTTDPLGRVTQYNWCTCGNLASITDPMGRVTTWMRDLQGRPTEKIYADGSTETYTYENASSRLHSVTNEKGETAVHTYNLDDTLAGITYQNAHVATPNVSFTYDQNYRRITSMVDGSGTTQFVYNPVSGQIGAGFLASVTSPLANSAITYAYDALGRLTGHTIDGASTQTAYDHLNRATSVTNPLGAFQFSYQATTRLLTGVQYPNGQSTSLAYFGPTQDLQLKEIKNIALNSSLLSQFDYTRDSQGKILTWTVQKGAGPAETGTMSYDAGDELLSDLITEGGATAHTYAYNYDAAGNRTGETIDGGTNGASYNGLNEIASNAQSAPAATYTWDAENRLASIISGSTQSNFSYDGFGRCVEIVEQTNNVVTSDKHLLWDGLTLAEERDASGANVTKRYYPSGVVLTSGSNAGNYYYTFDHLGSISEMTGTSGAIFASYAYDPYGIQSKLSGSLDADFAFTGDYMHAPSGLLLTVFRAYSPSEGRWLSRDPLGEMAAPAANLFTYVKNNPVNMIDPLGLNNDAAIDALMKQYNDLVEQDKAQRSKVKPPCAPPDETDFERQDAAIFNEIVRLMREDEPHFVYPPDFQSGPPENLFSPPGFFNPPESSPGNNTQGPQDPGKTPPVDPPDNVTNPGGLSKITNRAQKNSSGSDTTGLHASGIQVIQESAPQSALGPAGNGP